MKTIQLGVSKAPLSSDSDPLSGAAAFNSADIPFEHRDFNTAQLQKIFGCGKTTLFEEIIPQLEVYYEGSRLKATGASIIKYRERKLAEPRQSTMTPARMSQMVAGSIEARRRRKSKTQKENGAAAKARAP